jgi:hypothetical protein
VRIAQNEAAMKSSAKVKTSKAPEEPSGFKEVRARVLLSLPPHFIGNEAQGIDRHMSTYLMRFEMLVSATCTNFTKGMYLNWVESF